MSYSTDELGSFRPLYAADVPTYTNHWHYNAAREVVLDAPADSLLVRYTGDPALNNFAIYAHCLSDSPQVQPPLEVTHTWLEDGESKRAEVTLDKAGGYEVMVEGQPENESIEIAVSSLAR